MPELRDYQIEGVNIAVNAMRTEKSPFVIVVATGGGKSHMIADICRQINKPVLILQPNKEILEQNYLKLTNYAPDIDVGIYSASKNRKEIKKFTFATIGSIYKKPEEFMDFKYVIIDECHGVDPKNSQGMLTSFLREIHCEHVCGLTATPYRIAQLWLRDQWGGLTATASLKMINRISQKPFFKKILFKIETGKLIEMGYLSPIDYYVDGIDLDGLVVNSTGADFTKESMEAWWNEKRLSRIAAAVNYSNIHHKRTLVFCSSIRQAERAKLMVQDLGITAAMVTGTTPIPEREKIVDDFKKGRVKHLFNVGVFTTGFDVPELDCIVMARPTMSLALYYQIVGRGVRLDPGNPDKRLKFYDLVGVVERLGRIETIHVKTEDGGYRDEVWSEYGRMDNTELYSFYIEPKERKQ